MEEKGEGKNDQEVFFPLTNKITELEVTGGKK